MNMNELVLIVMFGASFLGFILSILSGILSGIDDTEKHVGRLLLNIFMIALFGVGMIYTISELEQMSPVYKTSCSIGDETVYVETSKQLPDFDLYDICFVQIQGGE